MSSKPCPRCGTIVTNPRTATRGRCDPCHEKYTALYRSPAWRDLSRVLRAEWVEEHGWVCPGWKRPPHPATDLQVHHLVPPAGDPTLHFDEDNLQVLCRSCNNRAKPESRNKPPIEEVGWKRERRLRKTP